MPQEHNEQNRCVCGHKRIEHDREGCAHWDKVPRPLRCDCPSFRPAPTPTDSVSLEQKAIEGAKKAVKDFPGVFERLKNDDAPTNSVSGEHCEMCDGGIGCAGKPEDCQCHRPAPQASSEWKDRKFFIALEEVLDEHFPKIYEEGEAKRLNKRGQALSLFAAANLLHNSSLTTYRDKIVAAVEKKKQTIQTNCKKGKDTHGVCAGCAERKGTQKGLSIAKDIIKELPLE